MKSKELKKVVSFLKKTTNIKVLHNDSDAVVLESANLLIGVFDYEYPNTNQAGRIMVDHKSNFDKWSKAYYSCTLPNEKWQYEVLLDDLSYVDSKAQENASNNFSFLNREW